MLECKRNMEILLSTLNCSYIHRNLGLRWLKVAASEGYKVTIKEFTIKEDYQVMLDYYLSFDCEVLAFGVYIYNVELIRRIIKDLKAQRCDLRILIGGPEVALEDDWFNLGVEAVFFGEAEVSFYQYLSTKQGDGVFTKNYQPDVKFATVDLNYLESLPSPYFLKEDLDKFLLQYFYLETSRGCPFGCGYCFSANNRNVRFFSYNYIKEIFKRLSEYSVKQVKLLDRTFNINANHAINVSKLIDKHSKDTTFQLEIVIDIMDNQYIDYLLKEAKSEKYRFEVGIQSFNDLTLRAINRKQDNELVKSNIKKLIKRGFIIHGDLIAGLPFETLKTFKTAFNQLYLLNVSEIQVGILKLLKNTPLFMKIKEYEMVYDSFSPYQIISNKTWSKEDTNIVEIVSLAVEKLYNNKRLLYTLKELIRDPDEAFDSFYELGLVIQSLNKPYSNYELFTKIYQRFMDEKLIKAINIDYYRGSKNRIKRLFEDNTSKSDLKALADYCLVNGICNNQDFYNKTMTINLNDCFLIIYYNGIDNKIIEIKKEDL